MFKDGTAKVLLDICKVASIPYNFNHTTGIFEATKLATEYDFQPWSDTNTTPYHNGFYIKDSLDITKQFPFHLYYTTTRPPNGTNKNLYDILSISTDYDYSSIANYFNIKNIPHSANIEEYYNALPQNLSIRKEFDVKSPLNLDATTSYLNPSGVRNWDGSIDPPTPPDIDISDVDPILLGLDEIAKLYGTYKCKEAADAMAKYLELQKKILNLLGCIIRLKDI